MFALTTQREQGREVIRVCTATAEGQLTRRLKVALLAEPLRPPRHRLELHGGDGRGRAGALRSFNSLGHVLYFHET